jgi:hypothetical protein
MAMMSFPAKIALGGQIISVRLATVLRAPFESRVKRIGDVWDNAGDGPGLFCA